jgi:hypothetical protein
MKNHIQPLIFISPDNRLGIFLRPRKDGGPGIKKANM